MSGALVLRRSAVDAFSCPYRFKALHVDGLRDDSDEAIRGRAFHAAARRYIAALWQTRQREDLTLATEAFAHGMLDERTPAHLLPEVSDLFWSKWAPDFELDLDAYLSHEERQVDDAHFTWTPDLLYARDEVLEIPDLKTYWIGFSDAQAKQELQARFYAASARRLYPGFQQYRVIFQFVRWGFSAAATFDGADLDLVDTELAIARATIEQAIARDEFPAVAGQHCGFCRLECPLLTDARQALLQIVSPDAARTVAAETLVLEQALRQRKAALSAWCAGEGPVTVGGMEFSHRKTEKATFPIAAVLAVLAAQDITPTFTVSKSTLRPYLESKRFAHVREDMEALAVVKATTEFRARKAGAVGDEAEAV